MKKILFIIIMCIGTYATMQAQDYINVFHTYENEAWKIPYTNTAMQQFDFTTNKKILEGNFICHDGSQMIVPLRVADIDSITWTYDLIDAEKGHNHYKVFTMNIITEEQTEIANKDEWLKCIISIDGKGEFSDYCGSGRIRGRGNSSWEWYNKKPYKFKLDNKSKILGLGKAKNWNLLANYRDLTDLMNTFAFEAARYMGMPFTNHTRYIEVFLNNKYIGLYQLTEKIEIGKNRVDIDETEGVLLSFDQDDGPSLSPNATDNFWSTIYNLPICIKHPSAPSAEKVDSVKTNFARLELAIKNKDYTTVKELMDVKSFINILLMHEFLYNVEIDAPRSLYAYKDKDGKYTFGPVWDWDAGYDFDWSNMYTGHTFFTNYKELLYGTNPVKQNGAYKISKFFINLFNVREFVEEYKQTWAQISDSIFLKPWQETQKYIEELSKGAYRREIVKWPVQDSNNNLSKETNTETSITIQAILSMSNWLQNRKSYLDGVIAAYPLPKNNAVISKDTIITGAISIDVNCVFTKGYTQNKKIVIDESKVYTYLDCKDLASLELIPLDADGDEGTNTAAGTYGAWFGNNGNTTEWAFGHVYVESNDLFVWNYGCHPNNCWPGDSHTVRMRFLKNEDNVVKVVDVFLNFLIV
jgi:hypothetical protein